MRMKLLRRTCYLCFRRIALAVTGPKKQKGKIRLDQLDPDLVKGKSTETWHDALNMLNLGKMPPEDEPQLTRDERHKLVGWLTKVLRRVIDARQNKGGQVVIRRLNRAEYQYTMTDLLGLDMDYSEEFPSDAISGDGFRNNGASLEVSALQIENYLKVARAALDIVLAEGEQQERTITKVERNKGEVKGLGSKRFIGNSSDRLGRVNFWHGSFKDLPRTDAFTIRIRAYTDRKPGNLPPSSSLGMVILCRA